MRLSTLVLGLVTTSALAFAAHAESINRDSQQGEPGLSVSHEPLFIHSNE